MLGSKYYYRWDLYYTWVQLLHLCLLQTSLRGPDRPHKFGYPDLWGRKLAAPDSHEDG